MKPTIKTLQKEIEKLEKKVSKIPDLKVCSECGTLKLIEEFKHTFCSFGRCFTNEKEYCKSCNEKVNERNKAVSIAKKEPAKVIKWWGGR